MGSNANKRKRKFLKDSQKVCSCENYNSVSNKIKINKSDDCIGIRNHKHLVCKRTLSHLAELASLAKWLSVLLRTNWL